ncbi:MAG: hypothetical protein ACP5O2_08840 [Bacteroidales bacterium]
MIQKLRNNPSGVALALIFIILATVRVFNPPNNILSYDTFGYYIHLPARYIYHDPGLKNFQWVEEINKTYKCTPTLYQFAEGQDGQKVIRFYRGMSFVLTPAFWAGDIWARLSGAPRDGFSRPYTTAVWLWSLILNFIGLWFSRKILLRYFDEKTTTLTLILMFLVSNLYFFMGYGNEIPHVHLFSLITLLIWLTIRWHNSPDIKIALAGGLTAGLIVVSRPSEALVLLIPLLWGVYDKETAKAKLMLFLKNWPSVIAMGLGLILPIIPQLLYWKSVSGEWFFQAYNDPGSQLDLQNPRLLHTLLSFRKGWLIYSPVMVFALWGLWKSIRDKKVWGWAAVSYFILNLYLIASFTSLISYGWRAFIQTYAALLLPMALFARYVIQLRRVRQYFWGIILIFLGILNIFQAMQIHLGTISGSRMTRAYYFATLFKKYPSDKDRELLLPDRPATGKESLNNTAKFFNRVVRFYDYETPNPAYNPWLDSTLAYSGHFSLRLDSTLEFPRGLECKFGELTNRSYAYIRISVRIFPDANVNPLEKSPVLLVTHSIRDNQVFKYAARSISDTSLYIKPGRWNYFWMDYMTPEGIKPDDGIKSYLWFRGKKGYHIDDLRIEVFEPMEDSYQ